MKPASKSLREYGQIQRLVMIMIMLGGSYYWTLARFHTGPILSEEEYGPFILSFSAEFWSVPLAIGAAIHLLAQVVNGDDRLPPYVTPLFRFFASLIVSCNLLLFSYGGTYAHVWGPYFAYSFMAGIITLWFSALGLNDLVRGFRNNGLE